MFSSSSSTSTTTTTMMNENTITTALAHNWPYVRAYVYSGMLLSIAIAHVHARPRRTLCANKPGSPGPANGPLNVYRITCSPGAS